MSKECIQISREFTNYRLPTVTHRDLSALRFEQNSLETKAGQYITSLERS
jgi:hypothetical protein